MTLQEIYEKYKPTAIYQVGSSCFLENARDKDIALYYESEEETEKAKKKLGEIWRNCDYDVHISNCEMSLIGSYACGFIKKLVGKDITIKNDFLTNKDRWCEIVRNSLGSFKDKQSKTWYHILAGCYIVKNGKYEFTSEQLANIQKVHDEKSITKELYDFVCDTLKK